MKVENEIINRVAVSPLITINLEDFYPEGERVAYDLKNNLFQEIILKEKDFRAFVATHDWSQYKEKFVALDCSVEAIVPAWAYMILASKLAPFAKKVVFGNLQALEQSIFQDALAQLDLHAYQDAKVVVKGCGHLPISQYAYVELVSKLHPVVSSIMYGEPCSTVPIYKRPKQKQ